MERDAPETGADDRESELACLLRALRVEPTPEAHFEERFLSDFRERVVRESVCRSARSVLWEHFCMFMGNLGMRRVAWGATTFGLGALCVGVLAWRVSGPVQQRVHTELCELEARANSLQPGISHHVTCMAVGPRKLRNSEKNVVILTDEEEDSPLYGIGPSGTPTSIRRNFSNDSLTTPVPGEDVSEFFRFR